MTHDDSASRGPKGRDRRRSRRIEVRSHFAGYSVTLGVPVTVLDISLGGLRIESSVVLPLGAIHEFSFTLADRAVIKVRARVLHCGLHPAPRGLFRYSAGLEFVNGPNNVAQRDVLRLIEEVRSTAIFSLQ
jgi:hypothetical protein